MCVRFARIAELSDPRSEYIFQRLGFAWLPVLHLSPPNQLFDLKLGLKDSPLSTRYYASPSLQTDVEASFLYIFAFSFYFGFVFVCNNFLLQTVLMHHCDFKQMVRPVLCTLSVQMRRLCLSSSPSEIWTVVAVLTLQKRQFRPVHCSATQ